MFVIEIFLPLYNNQGARFSRSDFDAVRAELSERFGGVTAFLRAPALGEWEDESGKVYRDEIAVFEVMAEEIDKEWWRTYRRELEARFEQREILIRATSATRL